MTSGTQGFSNPYEKPLGYVQQTSLGAATGLSGIPASATMAVIAVEAQAIRWRDDGTNPTASTGMPVAVGQTFAYTGTLSALKIIQQVAGAIINVAYYA